MNKKKEKKILNIILIVGVSLIFTILFLGGLRGTVVNPIIDFNEVCEWEYGINWTYENTISFGKTCVKLNYTSLEAESRKSFSFSSYEDIYGKYCNIPKALNFRKWSADCGPGVKG